MNDQVKELFDTLMCNYDFPATFAEGLAEFLYDEDYRLQKEGHWTFPDHGGISYYKCSCCGYELERPLTYTRDDVNKYRRYCTHCGAKMFREYYD